MTGLGEETGATDPPKGFLPSHVNITLMIKGD